MNQYKSNHKPNMIITVKLGQQFDTFLSLETNDVKICWLSKIKIDLKVCFANAGSEQAVANVCSHTPANPKEQREESKFNYLVSGGCFL